MTIGLSFSDEHLEGFTLIYTAIWNGTLTLTIKHYGRTEVSDDQFLVRLLPRHRFEGGIFSKHDLNCFTIGTIVFAFFLCKILFLKKDTHFVISTTNSEKREIVNIFTSTLK